MLKKLEKGNLEKSPIWQGRSYRNWTNKQWTIWYGILYSIPVLNTICVLLVNQKLVSSAISFLRFNTCTLTPVMAVGRQGRIQNLKLGMAQKNWKIWKKKRGGGEKWGGGGGGVGWWGWLRIYFKDKIFIVIVYIFQLRLRYTSNKLYNIVLKNLIWKNLGVARARCAPF